MQILRQTQITLFLNAFYIKTPEVGLYSEEFVI